MIPSVEVSLSGLQSLARIPYVGGSLYPTRKTSLPSVLPPGNADSTMPTVTAGCDDESNDDEEETAQEKARQAAIASVVIDSAQVLQNASAQSGLVRGEGGRSRSASRKRSGAQDDRAASCSLEHYQIRVLNPQNTSFLGCVFHKVHRGAMGGRVAATWVPVVLEFRPILKGVCSSGQGQELLHRLLDKTFGANLSDDTIAPSETEVQQLPGPDEAPGIRLFRRAPPGISVRAKPGLYHVTPHLNSYTSFGSCQLSQS